MKSFKFSYDRGNDDLFLYSPLSKSMGSIEMGDLIADYNSDKELVGIQLLHASTLLQELAGKNARDIQTDLSNLKKCSFSIKKTNGLLFVKIHFESESGEMNSVFSLPNLQEMSPALACN
ncbi:MAG: DUF2283 domain-containing protein [Nanoarchaeota archaeon]